jgi:hypothetical protein
VRVVASSSLVNDDGVASNGVTTQRGGNELRLSEENFDMNDVASNSSGDVSSVGVDEKSVKDILCRNVRKDLSTDEVVSS